MSDNISTKDLKITVHAVYQRMLRTGALVAQENKIRGIVAFGSECYPRKKRKYPARYFTRNELVAVVVNGKVVTVHKYNPELFTLVKK